MSVTKVVRWLQRRARPGLVAGAGLLMAAASVQASPLLVEDFDNVAGLTGFGWTLTNNSSTPGLTGWFQGDQQIFASQAGAPEAYIAANFNNASAPLASSLAIFPSALTK